VIDAVASAIPSISPTDSALAPSPAIRNTGNRLWINSDEVSINRLTRPNAQMLLGIARRPVASGGAPSGVSAVIGDLAVR
jgi:hypothetical protein